MSATEARTVRRNSNRAGRRHRAGAAFSLIEGVFCTVIVGVMFAAAVGAVGSSRVAQYKVQQRCLGRHLANSLMAEILQQDYVEPVDNPVFGPEPAEGQTSRAIYDDVDDYHRWSASPPQYKDGTVMLDLTGWKREAYVHYVRADDLGTAISSDEGVKRVTVKVSHNGLPVITLWGICTRNDQQTEE
ncbi:MAG: hypothetical protein B1H04_05860 [Planctomycetales bacterium 4484_123]|nr:MAG: hypothetical protein B1H04_05860 [Planctomycetales bacterium 4484_123]